LIKIEKVNMISGYFKLLLLRMLGEMKFLPVRIRYKFTDLLAMLSYLIFARKRDIVRKNLSIILNTKVPENNVKDVFKHYGRYWAELPDIEQLWKKENKIICGPDFPPSEKSFLGISFHIGNFELFGPALFDHFGVDLNVIAERLYPQALFDYFYQMRKRHHIHTIAHDNVRAIVEVLKKGDPLGVLCDRSVDNKGVSIKLFGGTWVMPMSIIRYALSLDIPIYYAYCISEEGMIQVYCKKSSALKSFEDITEELTHTLEFVLRNYPLLWHNTSQMASDNLKI
jgi:lauroyl/myristoyl acyltransferase